MDKSEAILRYKAAMAVFKIWRKSGVITEEDLSAVSTALAQKYGLSTHCIFLETLAMPGKQSYIYY